MYGGREPFIYVADTDNDRIVLLNLDGQILGTKLSTTCSIGSGLSSKFIVCAQFDTVISGQPQTYSAVYKLDLVSVNHQIELAPVKRILPRSQDFCSALRNTLAPVSFMIIHI